MKWLMVIVIAGLPIYAQAQIFTWIDEAGNTHYGDRPPLDTPARLLDPNQLTVSTVGETALREGEQQLLDQFDEAARAQAEAQTKVRRSSPAPVVVNVDAGSRDRGLIYGYPYPYHRKYRRKHRGGRFGLALAYGNFSNRTRHSRPPHCRRKCNNGNGKHPPIATPAPKTAKIRGAITTPRMRSLGK